MTIRTLMTAIPVLFLLAAVPVLADDDDEREHDRVLEALRAGEVLSLRTILDRATADHPGDLLEAELEHEHGLTIYELKLLSPEGRVVKLEYDARTGELLKASERRRR